MRAIAAASQRSRTLKAAPATRHQGGMRKAEGGFIQIKISHWNRVRLRMLDRKKWQLEKLIDPRRQKCSITADLGLEATTTRRGAFSNVLQAVKIRGELGGPNAAHDISICTGTREAHHAAFHSLLLDLLSFQNTFKVAGQLLQAPTTQRMSFHVAKDIGSLLSESAIHSLTPQVGVMVL
jgi:hypothetical protein